MAAGKRISSAINGLSPKATGGIMAVGGAMGIAAGVASYRHGKASGNPRGFSGSMGVGMMAGGATAMLSPTARRAYGRI